MGVVDLAELKETCLPASACSGSTSARRPLGWPSPTRSLTVATPSANMDARKILCRCHQLLALIAQHSVGGLVVGLPLNMDGSDGPSAQSARAFARNFAARHEIPITLWDERLSTAAVTRTLIEADSSRAGACAGRRQDGRRLYSAGCAHRPPENASGCTQ